MLNKIIKVAKAAAAVINVAVAGISAWSKYKAAKEGTSAFQETTPEEEMIEDAKKFLRKAVTWFVKFLETKGDELLRALNFILTLIPKERGHESNYRRY